jgi:hypothetical protein
MESEALGTIRIANPCSERWEQMSGDERVRHCAKCQLKVYNFAELTAAEARQLILTSQGRLCGRLYQRRDGTILTQDCPVGLRRARVALAAALSVAAGVVIAMVSGGLGARVSSAHAAAVPAFSELAERAEMFARGLPLIGELIEWLDPSPVMGEIVMPPPPPPPGPSAESEPSNAAEL